MDGSREVHVGGNVIPTVQGELLDPESQAV
jgi:hypothetical protein